MTPLDFKLKRPCKNCPFSKSCHPGWLRRAREIVDDMLQRQATFACHETTTIGGARPGQEQHCAGALIIMEREGRLSDMAQIAARLGLYDPDQMDLASPAFDTFDDFIAHHERTP